MKLILSTLLMNFFLIYPLLASPLLKHDTQLKIQMDGLKNESNSALLVSIFDEKNKRHFPKNIDSAVIGLRYDLSNNRLSSSGYTAFKNELNKTKKSEEQKSRAITQKYGAHFDAIDSRTWSVSKLRSGYADLIISNLENDLFEIQGLPPGKYAIAIFQDLPLRGIGLNNNLDFLTIIPREPLGFSTHENSPERLMGAPTFSQFQVELTGRDTLEIELK